MDLNIDAGRNQTERAFAWIFTRLDRYWPVFLKPNVYKLRLIGGRPKLDSREGPLIG
jgi:hypothetical protein